MQEVETVANDVANKASVIKNIMDHSIEAFGTTMVSFVGKFILAILVLVIGFKCIKYIVKFCEKVFDKSRVDPTLKTFLLSAIKIGLKVMILFWAITILGVATSSVIAVLGSAAVALALSLQGSLSNIAGGVILLFMKPFQVGDFIREDASGKEGYVESIGIMYTKLRTIDNQIVLIPNGALSSDTITNVSGQPERQEDITVGIEYAENIQKVRNVLQQIIDEEEKVLREKPIEIFVNGLEDSFIEMRIRFWVETAEYWTCRWRTLENIKNCFDENGINIPFNQLDVNIKQ